MPFVAPRLFLSYLVSFVFVYAFLHYSSIQETRTSIFSNMGGGI